MVHNDKNKYSIHKQNKKNTYNLKACSFIPVLKAEGLDKKCPLSSLTAQYIEIDIVAATSTFQYA